MDIQTNAERWGYIRVSVSKEEQAAGWEDQRATLLKNACDPNRIYEEEASTRHERPVFQRMLSDAIDRAADTGKPVYIVCTKMDRAFRDVTEAQLEAKRLPKHNVFLTLLDLSDKPLNPNDPAQVLLFHITSAIAQFERDRLAERRAVGIAKAKAEGRYKGRVPTAQRKAPEVLDFYKRGFKPNEIAKQANVSRASVYRILKDHREGQSM
ncbi:recombinase family protein [Pseudohalocynthiibacter aestuariivivens]|uniref:Recombinase family protein n=1 Tax=Pseudohalocynthiibacter aestuariivivens TaxID=1591409 RepID=A0ABV5JJ72_9RHOB|nr:recombinase family protein [Pseudohalocynthiibacter aestuariivivens]MBS9716739.1 recombinase family protein [Pseudohalocynthiibacter aestuariivivens]